MKRIHDVNVNNKKYISSITTVAQLKCYNYTGEITRANKLNT